MFTNAFSSLSEKKVNKSSGLEIKRSNIARTTFVTKNQFECMELIERLMINYNSIDVWAPNRFSFWYFDQIFYKKKKKAKKEW